VVGGKGGSGEGGGEKREKMEKEGLKRERKKQGMRLTWKGRGEEGVARYG